MPVDTTGPKCPHGNAYGGIEQCGECRQAASINVKSASPKADMRELELWEREYREQDKRLRRIANEILDDGTAQERGLAIKMLETAVKCARFAKECRTDRIGIEHDQWMGETALRVRGGSGN